MSPSLAGQARAGTAWVALQGALKQGTDLLVFLCLARWLAPESFGLMASVNTVLTVLLMLAEWGLIEALVQRRRLGPVARDTAFWLALAGAALLALALAVLAWPMARGFGQDQIRVLSWSASPLVLATALNVVPQALLQRQMRFGPLARRAMAGTLAGALAGVGLAAAGAGAWSLLGQQLASATVALALLWRTTEWRPRRRFSIRSARALLSFGRHVMAARALNVVASKIDDALIGAMLGPVALGLYAVASRLRLALEQLFCQGVDAIALSTFCRLAGEPADLARAYLRATRMAVSLAAPVFVSVGWLAPHLLPLVMGPRWQPAMATLQILLLAGLLQSFLHFNHAVFRATGQPQRSWQLGAASLLLNLVLSGVAVRWGIEAVAGAYVLRIALIGPLGTLWVARTLGLDWRALLRAVGVPTGMALLCAVVGALPWHGGWWPGRPAWLLTLLACLSFLTLYGVWLALALRRPGRAAFTLRNAPGDSPGRRWAPGASRAIRRA